MTTLIPLPRKVLAASLTFLLGAGACTTAQAAGLMTPASGALPKLEIRQHHVDVTVEDGYAVTTVEQEFFNPHSTALEAIYSFPVPEQAAVGEFTYWIDGVPVTGEILEKARAREVYEQEKAQGRETALTEKDAYRSFDSSVYPVRAQSAVKIRLVYLQPVHVDMGIGRYVYPLEEGGVDEQKLAFWTYQEEVSGSFSFDFNLRSSYPVDGLRLPQHSQAAVTQQGPGEWQASLANGSATVDEEGVAAAAAGAAHRLDEDIVVYWRHQQGLPGSVDMVTHKPPGSERGTFMMTLTPGDDLKPVTAGRDWVFVLDISGSMQGKYHSLVEGIKGGLNKLHPDDRFRIVLFNSSTRELTPGFVAATPKEIQRYMVALENVQPGSGTNLYAGLDKGIRGLDADRPSALVLVTDGVANVGVTEKKDFLELLEQHDVRLFTFVMGNSANRPLLDGMTAISNGFAMSISNGDDIVGRLVQVGEKLSHEAYRDIDVRVDGVKVRDLSPANISSLYRGQQLILMGHYWGDGPADVTIRGKVGAENREYKTRFDFPARSERNPEIERLWAYASIEDLQARMDYLGADADSEQAVVDLAMEYGLVTDYTSMVVVREDVFKQLGMDRKNATRVALEQQARQHRAANSVQNNRADSQQPAFNSPRATPSGGGAMGPWSLLMLLPLLLAGRRRRS
ncbi:MAG: VIT and VWA domain-containing protein [Pseudomonadota bacterium]